MTVGGLFLPGAPVAADVRERGKSRPNNHLFGRERASYGLEHSLSTGRTAMQLAERPEDVPAAFVERFNSGDPALAAEMYEDDGVLVLGSPLTGEAAHGANAHLMSLGVPMTARTRHVHTTGDLALLIVDWVIEGTGPDGEPVRMEGTATDVARRGHDGYWRYVIDNPFGVQEFEGPPQQ